MKALRLSLVSFTAFSLASAAFAGAAPRYTKSRSAVPAAPAEKSEMKADKDGCATMSVTHGRFTRTVKCDMEKVPGCKDHCEK